MTLSNPLSWPDDLVRWSCVGLAIVVGWWGTRWLDRERVPQWLAWVAPLTAAALSWAYIHTYLRGGPRIIDATAYFLEARTFAEGMFSFPLPEPEQSVMGRFLVRTAHDPARGAVIFPPGYPAVLSVGFHLGAPTLVGPCLAAGIVRATMDLAKTAARLLDVDRPATMIIFATWASVACAALRYHTADTMAHGLAALCVAVAFAAALRLTDGRSPMVGLALGLSGGLLFATRPASALALTLATSPVLLSLVRRHAWRPFIAMAVGASGPLALWLAFQHHVTGSAFDTAQSAYYLASDGPLHCFRYGFGEGIGCRGEHGTFVDANLTAGYGPWAALRTTGRRLMMHVSDALGVAPAFAAVLVGGWIALRREHTRPLGWMVLAQIAAYAPFYFDGNYPGGGARMFADVLPIEHVLAAIAISMTPPPRWRWPSWSAPVIAAGLIGFAFHLGAHHQQLRDREGGQPMFSPSPESERAPLLFVGTDHGFNLAFDPGSPGRVARWRGDDTDRLAWVAANQPQTMLHGYDFETGDESIVEHKFESPSDLRIGGGSLWPPRAQNRGWAFARYAGGANCPAARPMLMVTPTNAQSDVRVVIPRAFRGRRLTVEALPTEGNTTVTLRIYSNMKLQHELRALLEGGAGCQSVPPIPIPDDTSNLELGVDTDRIVGIVSLTASVSR